jgi:hypothetical protein
VCCIPRDHLYPNIDIGVTPRKFRHQLGNFFSFGAECPEDNLGLVSIPAGTALGKREQHS